MFEFNPSVFIYKKNLYTLIRCETDVSNWNNSKLAYKLCKLDSKFNILTTKICTFKINNEIFKITPNRLLLKKNIYCIEDIKILKYNINNKILGVTNILLQQEPYRIFRVGLIELDIEKNIIKLIKILEIDKMENTEKIGLYSNIIKNF